MAIRQRTWTWKGKEKSAWVVDYFDVKGKRRLKTFRTKRAADDWRSETRIELKQGIHVAARDGITVAEAGELWIAACESDGLERATIANYKQLLRLHIEPHLGAKKLQDITVPVVRSFQDALRADGVSIGHVKKVLTHLGGIIADAQERGLAMRNPVRERKRRRKRGKEAERHKKQLEVGVDIPMPAEIRVLIGAARGYARAIIITASMSGLRASELRGLRWQDVDLVACTITVSQRADKFCAIGAPKSGTSRRTVPIGAMVVNTLKEWKLACPRRDTGRKDANGEAIKELHYVFPNENGQVETYQQIQRLHWHPLQIAAGVTKSGMDEDGNAVVLPKYSGLHNLRHFYASWCANSQKKGGLGLLLKEVQQRLGHSTLAQTADTYSHLFPSQDDAEVLAAGERALMEA